MDPVTHLLASYTLARAARTRIASPEMAVFLLAGLAPDLDWLWHLPAPFSPLRAYGTVTHSLVGAAALAVTIAVGIWAAFRRRAPMPPALSRLLVAGFAAAGLHLLLDLCANTDIELYWPFRAGRIAWNMINGFDIIPLLLLAVFALFSALFSLVTEEIGARRDPRPPRGWPVAALVLLLLLFGARAILQSRAESLLVHADYQGSAPRHWAAFPNGVSPFTWRGVVETDSFLAEVEVPVGLGGRFAPERAQVRFKPEASSALDAAAATPLARAYTSLARFPIVTIESTPTGARAELRELGDSPLRTRSGTWTAVIEFDPQSKALAQTLRFEATRTP
ncbi:MAG TPA: metal-dependent hydrolase [Candidatus Acidoferrales bacterium]|nr:metal-dependent hydrolase [Candidatus Acidoferrales bacterium]